MTKVDLQREIQIVLGTGSYVPDRIRKFVRRKGSLTHLEEEEAAIWREKAIKEWRKREKRA